MPAGRPEAKRVAADLEAAVGQERVACEQGHERLIDRDIRRAAVARIEIVQRLLEERPAEARLERDTAAGLGAAVSRDVVAGLIVEIDLNRGRPGTHVLDPDPGVLDRQVHGLSSKRPPADGSGKQRDREQRGEPEQSRRHGSTTERPQVHRLAPSPCPTTTVGCATAMPIIREAPDGIAGGGASVLAVVRGEPRCYAASLDAPASAPGV